MILVLEELVETAQESLSSLKNRVIAAFLAFYLQEELQKEGLKGKRQVRVSCLFKASRLHVFVLLLGHSTGCWFAFHSIYLSVCACFNSCDNTFLLQVQKMLSLSKARGESQRTRELRDRGAGRKMKHFLSSWTVEYQSLSSFNFPIAFDNGQMQRQSFSLFFCKIAALFHNNDMNDILFIFTRLLTSVEKIQKKLKKNPPQNKEEF